MAIGKEELLYLRIDEVLYYIWDPIGVNEQPFARGEYSSYVPKVMQLLLSGESKEAIASHLLSIMVKSMGIGGDQERCERAADFLLTYKQAVDDGIQ